MSEVMNITLGIINAIKKHHTITIFRHIQADGDAYGSQLGLAQIIRDNFPDKEVIVLGETSLHWSKLMGKMDKEVTDQEIMGSLAIIVDTANLARIDDNRYRLAKEIIKIDHHLVVESFNETTTWVDTQYSATSEMIVKLAIDNKLLITPTAATYLYVGIITDTNRYLYPNTTPLTLDYGAYLMECGANLELIHDFVYSVSVKDVKLKGYIMYNFTKTANGLAYLKIDKKLRHELGLAEGGAAGAVNAMANINTVKIHLLMLEKDDGKIKVELRSKKIPIVEIATRYGGGGHSLASGVILKDWETADKMLLELEEICIKN
jgi:bifunctional oligoribonuclease and PAP phosphatase NrnA